MYPVATSQLLPSSYQPLWYDVPVSPVEQLFLHVIVQAWTRRAGWVLIVEDQLRRLVIPGLQEAHHLTIVDCFSFVRLLTAQCGDQASGYHLRLKVSCRAALGDRQISGIADRIDVSLPLDFQGVAIRGYPSLRIAKSRLFNDFCATMRWYQYQEIILNLLTLQRTDHFSLRIHRFSIEEGGVGDIALFQQRRCYLCYAFNRENPRQWEQVLNLG